MSSVKNKKKVQVLIAAEGELLLLKLAENRGGFWQNVTGGVDGDESFEVAAERELWEETGIKAKTLPLNFEFNFQDRFQFNVLEKAFFCILDRKINPLLSSEHQDFKWIKFNKINESDFKFKTNFEAFLKLKATVE